ncbi:MAG: DedA family protein [Acidimicrobiales bacterium]
MIDLFALGRPWSYVIAFVLPALDGIFPVVPSESAVVTLGVATAGSTDPRIGVLVLLAAAGAFLGDNLSYLIGRHFGPWASRRFFAGEKGERRQRWAERTLGRHGPLLLIACRFIPGGRTAVTLTCGVTGYSRRRFVLATAIAAAVWALYAFLVGRLGGHVFEDTPWLGLVGALGFVLSLSLLVEALRRSARWLRRRPAPPSWFPGIPRIAKFHPEFTSPPRERDGNGISCDEKGGCRVDRRT